MLKFVYWIKYWHILSDIVLFCFSAWLSMSVVQNHGEKFGTLLGFTHVLWPLILISTVCKLLFFIPLGVYTIIWRYVSLADATRLGVAIFASSLLMIVCNFALSTAGVMSANELLLGVFLVDGLFAFLLTSGIRAGRRIVHERISEMKIKEHGKLTLIYGAGANGLTLANRFKTDRHLDLNIVGFIDDDVEKVGHSIAGIRVLGSRKDLPGLLLRFKIQELIFSVTDLPGDTLREVMECVGRHGIRPRLITDFMQSAEAKNRFELFRDVELDDLLNRPQTRIDLESIRELSRGKRILITGAGGSIGSEIARQVWSFNPGRLLILDSSEFNLYTIDSELRTSSKDTSFIVPLLIDIRDRDSLALALREYRPEIVFHAAAYKHVHLVEFNPQSAILNNVEGTKNLLDLCQEINVDTFVMISTDKAVNPGGTMGATKRVCELMVTSIGQKTGKRYCSVRFGNVVGSSGSLIPLLKKQIRAGGPVTITNKNMTRYFMLIREAVSLVLKAGSIASPGDICILQMGEPIKIVDIAKNLIMLLGRTEKEVPIVFTGSRPGEKLFEELYLSGDELSTEHPDILVLPRGDQLPSSMNGSINGIMNEGNLDKAILSLIQVARSGGKDVVGKLMAIVTPPARTKGKLAPTATAVAHAGHSSESLVAASVVTSPKRAGSKTLILEKS